VLLARESLGSTGIGEGIAIPHARNPIVLKVADPTVSLCYLEKPVEFGSLDGKPVSILFTLVSPTIRAHLSLLSQIAFVLHQPDFKRMILQKKSAEEILAAVRQIESQRFRTVNPVRPLGKGSLNRR
jgi:PTS system nitrogen regulatory IIA component